MSSKRYKLLPQDTRKLESNTIENLVKIVKKNCTSKFDESVDLSVQLNLKQKKNELNIRTVHNLPVGIEKKIKVAVICEEEKLEEASSKLKNQDTVVSDQTQAVAKVNVEYEKIQESFPNMRLKESQIASELQKYSINFSLNSCHIVIAFHFFIFCNFVFMITMID